MGTYGILLVLLIVVVSGGIAYLGDIIGRRMGRKRLTLFGLRPRYTAIVISVVAGMLIAGLTLGGAMLFSEEIRIAFTRVDDLRQQNKRLRTEQGSLRAEIDQRNQELTTTRRQSAQATAEAKTLAARITAQRAALAKSTAALQKSRQKLAGVEKDLAGAEKDLGNAVHVLQRTDDRWAYTLQEWRARAQATISGIRSSRITFAANEEIGTVALAKGLTRPQVVRQLAALLNAANRLAVERGAKPDDQQNAIAILGPDRSGKNLVRLAPQAAVDAVAEAVAGSPTGAVVRLSSLGNAVAGEPVVADFQAFRSRQIYHEGATLAEVTVDGGQPDSQLFAQLITLLKERVGARARTDGMMPVSRQLLNGTLVPQAGVGGMTYDELFDRVARIKALGGPVKVVAKAAADAWTAGPLQVTLEISKP